MSNAMQMPSCSWLWIFARFAGLVGCLLCTSAVAGAGAGASAAAVAAANHTLVLPFATHDLWHCDRCRCGCVCVMCNWFLI